MALVNALTNLGGAFVMAEQSGNQQFLFGLHLMTGLGFPGCYLLARKRGIYQELFWPFVLLIAVFLGVNLLPTTIAEELKFTNKVEPQCYKSASMFRKAPGP